MNADTTESALKGVDEVYRTTEELPVYALASPPSADGVYFHCFKVSSHCPES